MKTPWGEGEIAHNNNYYSSDDKIPDFVILKQIADKKFILAQIIG